MEKALKKLDAEYSLEEVIGYGNIEKFSHHQFANLCKNGSIIKHIPERTVYCTNCRPEGFTGGSLPNSNPNLSEP
ncbi:hypothetical protein F2Q69_00045686 [Brassica cretica]|uniref:Uncharacterized protein n=1 Tax=Brassica cretica TaxID=69181 RepID=A0A8S9NGQ0_BRACR|nr:hypothetical protein F2Q69_00045686 [Brassica cretica]